MGVLRIWAFSYGRGTPVQVPLKRSTRRGAHKAVFAVDDGISLLGSGLPPLRSLRLCIVIIASLKQQKVRVREREKERERERGREGLP